jgi:glucose-1-phosphate cytidylyltransferase
MPGASAGFFVFERKIFDYLDGDECILEREPLERLARERQLMSYQ